MSRRSGLGPVPIPASLYGLLGVTPADGSVQVASGGQYAPLAKGAAGKYLRVGAVSSNVGWYTFPDFLPIDHHLIAWAFDPALAGAIAAALSPSGSLYTTRVHVPEATTVTNILMSVSVAGAALTSGQCFAGIYQGGTLLGSTADQATAWASTGIKTMALAGGPVAVAAGDVEIGYFFNGTTGPRFHGGNAAGVLYQVGLTSTESRFGFAGGGGNTTAMPASLGTKSNQNILSIWAGLS